MKSFNVLDRDLSIHKNTLLEASAGTGKTFSIEHIVVRLLLEDNPSTKEPLSIEKILVVTFTKAATRDLKYRIRANIEKALSILHSPLNDQNDSIPDYLFPFIEQGSEKTAQAKQRLEQAIFCFDQAEIFTIHSFCARMLNSYVFEGDFSLDALTNDEQLSDQSLLNVIRNFFRTEIKPEIYSIEQINLLLKKYKNKFENLEQALLKTISRGYDIVEVDNFSTLFNRFRSIMKQLKGLYLFSKDHLIADYHKQISCYKKQGNHEENLDKITRFAALFNTKEWVPADFDLLIREGLLITSLLDPSQIKVKAKPPEKEALYYPQLIPILNHTLQPLIDQARNEQLVFALLAYHCQKMVKRYLHEEEKLRFDDFLHQMLNAVQNPQFVEKIQQQYQVAIIDEFQDTDPVQWKIFQTLFLSPNSTNFIYLVGDPKQSIYAFRQADIYTYLSAVNEIGQENVAALTTNYRSIPSLVSGLNRLFNSSNNPGMLSLPHIKGTLEYPEVMPSPSIQEQEFSDDFGSIHFYISDKPQGESKFLSLEDLEDTHFFPFMAQEIQKMKKQENLKLRQFAILVRDHRQAERLSAYLNHWGLHTTLQRQSSLCHSPALIALRELLKAILNPKDESALKIMLGGQIIRWTHSEIRILRDSINNLQLFEKILNTVYSLRKALFNEGFAYFFNALLHSNWKNDLQKNTTTISEMLLSQNSGIDFYHDLNQIANILIEHQITTKASPDELLNFLNTFETSQDSDQLQKIPDPSRDSIQIMTLHSSKGLEFDIVFALGLAKRTPVPDTLVPLETGANRHLVPILNKESAIYQNYCQECDAEKMRQLYVAMTRAKTRLYVPIAISSKVPPMGTASPMELFLARLDQPLVSNDFLYERIQSFSIQTLLDFIRKHQNDCKFSYSLLNEMAFELTKSEEKSHVSLAPPSVVLIPGSPQFMNSFTSISGYMKKNLTLDAYESTTPQDYQIRSKNPHTLPAGAKTGIILHTILEKIPFKITQDISQPLDLMPLIQPHIEQTELKDWSHVFCEMIYHVLKAPLNTNNNSFSLEDLDASKIFREIEFLYPYKNNQFIEDLNISSGYLKGVIDLLFEYQGKTYIVDWKSNWLGDSQKSYETENLKLCMEANHYFLQASIYTKALQKFLRIMDNTEFSELFGGVFYIFLRGVDTSQQSQTGIYYFNPLNDISCLE